LGVANKMPRVKEKQQKGKRLGKKSGWLQKLVERNREIMRLHTVKNTKGEVLGTVRGSRKKGEG